MKQGGLSFCKGCTKEYEGEHFSWEGGKWSAFDKNGKIVISAIYDNDFSFNKNRQAEVSKKKRFLLI